MHNHFCVRLVLFLAKEKIMKERERESRIAKKRLEQVLRIPWNSFRKENVGTLQELYFRVVNLRKMCTKDVVASIDTLYE